MPKQKITESRARRFTENGTPIETEPLSLPPDVMIADGVWNGSSYFGVWASPSTYPRTITSVFLDSAAAPIGSPISIAQGECPDVSWDGVNHFVVWSNA